MGKVFAVVFKDFEYGYLRYNGDFFSTVEKAQAKADKLNLDMFDEVNPSDYDKFFVKVVEVD